MSNLGSVHVKQLTFNLPYPRHPTGVHSRARDGETGSLPGLPRAATTSGGGRGTLHAHLPQVHSRAGDTAQYQETGTVRHG